MIFESRALHHDRVQGYAQQQMCRNSGRTWDNEFWLLGQIPLPDSEFAVPIAKPRIATTAPYLPLEEEGCPFSTFLIAIFLEIERCFIRGCIRFPIN